MGVFLKNVQNVLGKSLKKLGITFCESVMTILENDSIFSDILILYTAYWEIAQNFCVDVYNKKKLVSYDWLLNVAVRHIFDNI